MFRPKSIDPARPGDTFAALASVPAALDTLGVRTSIDPTPIEMPEEGAMLTLLPTPAVTGILGLSKKEGIALGVSLAMIVLSGLSLGVSLRRARTGSV